MFSDILVVAEGLGQGYKFRDGGGIEMDFALRTTDDIKQLSVAALPERLAYIPRALQLVKSSLGDQTALIGFAGSPWTLANFMLEGGSAEEFTQRPETVSLRAGNFFDADEKLTAAVTRLLQMQILAGVDAVQIFDSHGGLLSGKRLRPRRPLDQTNHFRAEKHRARHRFFQGRHGNWHTLVDTGANVLGIDWTVRLADVRAQLPEHVGVQGNLDPALLMTKPEIVAAETGRILTEMRGASGHIFNLGHGVPPEAKLENIAALVETVKNFK